MPENAIYRIAKSWTSDVLFPKDIPQENVNIPVFVKEGLLVRGGGAGRGKIGGGGDRYVGKGLLQRCLFVCAR